MEAMRRGGLDTPPMGGGGGVVEVDETYFGNVRKNTAPRVAAASWPSVHQARAQRPR